MATSDGAGPAAAGSAAKRQQSLVEIVRERRKTLPLRERVERTQRVQLFMEGVRERLRKRRAELQQQEEESRAIQERRAAMKKRPSAGRLSPVLGPAPARRPAPRHSPPDSVFDAKDDEPVLQIDAADASSFREDRRRSLKAKRPLKTILVDHEGKEVKQVDCDHCGWRRIRHYFRHPTLRIFLVFSIMFANMLLYAEDPIAHSIVDARIPIVGTDLGMLFTRYPEGRGLLALKIIVIIFAVASGLLIGRQMVHHRLLRDSMQLRMFAENKGTWMVMLCTSIFVLLGCTWVYNKLILAISNANAKYVIDRTFGLSNENYTKVAASFVWLADYVTLCIVLDIVLQDKVYPEWGKAAREWYRKHRITIFWFVTISSIVTVISVIATDSINWDDYGNDFTSTSEFGRMVLVSWILTCDLCVIMQDWEFPTFNTPEGIYLPGFSTSHIKFTNCSSWLYFEITGKWFNYTLIMILLLLDANNMRLQLNYEPALYGQYVGPDDTIYVIQNATDLALFLANPQSFNTTGRTQDLHLDQRFVAMPYGLKLLILLPALLAIILFIVLVRFENPKRVIRMLRQERVGRGNNTLETLRLRSLLGAKGLFEEGHLPLALKYKTKTIPRPDTRGIELGDRAARRRAERQRRRRKEMRKHQEHYVNPEHPEEVV
jgi:hypothetical protein